MILEFCYDQSIMRNYALSVYLFGPVLAWMAFIFVMSSQAGSTEHSTTIVEALVKWVAPTFAGTLTPYQFECLDYGFRKTCHLTGYAVLALLLVRSLNRSNEGSVRNALASWFIAVVYAVTDEIHQSFVPMRTASLADVGIDAMGAAAAVLLVSLLGALGRADRALSSRLTKQQEPVESLPVVHAAAAKDAAT